MSVVVDHVAIAMPEGREAVGRAFYGAVLGLAEIAKPPGLTRAGAWFEAGGVQVHLTADRAFRPVERGHPAFRVADLDGTAERCRASGLPVDLDQRIEGVRRFFTADPFGNRIEVIQAKA